MFDQHCFFPSEVGLGVLPSVERLAGLGLPVADAGGETAVVGETMAVMTEDPSGGRSAEDVSQEGGGERL